MKKIIFGIIVLLGMLVPVKAADYNIRELIPVGVTTTVRGSHFNYLNLVYENGIITIEKVRNNKEEASNLSISIGLFDKSGTNIGTINYCPDNTPISPKQYSDKVTIDVKSSYMAEGKNHKDIQYISVIGENTNCRTNGALENVGQTVDQIGMAKNNTFNSSQMMLLNIVKVIVIVLGALFVYKFVFTNSYRNMDGADARQEYAYINKQLRKEREIDAKLNPPKPKVIKTHKTKEILQQEKEQQEKDLKNDAEIYDLYK